MLQNYVHNKAKIYISNISSYKKAGLWLYYYKDIITGIMGGDYI